MVTKKLHLQDDEEALLLLGEQDVHLRRLERDLGVEMFVLHDPHGQGVSLSIRGASSRVTKALKILKDMRERIRRGTAFDEELPSAPAHDPAEGVEGAAAWPKDVVYVTGFQKPIRPKSPRQKEYVEAIYAKDLVFGIGPAGTGKTFLAVGCALRALRNREVHRIVLTRPVVEAGEKLGFLPGDLYEKVHPYLKPLYDAFYHMLGPDKFRMWRQDEIVEIVPLAYMRGRTLENAFIILDEAQNTTPEQMKMFLTRMGGGSKAVVTGDITQIDLNTKTHSGLVLIQEILKGMEGAAFIRFGEEDVVRHDLVRKILRAYETWENRSAR